MFFRREKTPVVDVLREILLEIRKINTSEKKTKRKPNKQKKLIPATKKENQTVPIKKDYLFTVRDKTGNEHLLTLEKTRG